MHGPIDPVARPVGVFLQLVGTFRRFGSVSKTFHIEGSVAQRLANLCVGVRWSTNTTNYLRAVGRPPNYVSPEAWTDKVQWRKIFDRNPLLAIYADKVLARNHLKEVAPEVALPRVFWIGEDPEAIPFDTFEEPYVIKPNHSSGLILYVEDPAVVDRPAIIATCRRWLETRYGRNVGEWAYRTVRPRLIVEELLTYFNSEEKITNYKFFVFSGTVRYVQFESKTPEGYFLTFFDAEGERLRVRKWLGLEEADRMPRPLGAAKAPSRFTEMKRIAERIGSDIDMVRVDLYQVGETIYFSELTPYDGTGYSWLYREDDRFEGRPPQTLNDAFGRYWALPHIPLRQKMLNCMRG